MTIFSGDKLSCRRRPGASLVEVTCGSVVLIFVVLILIDLGILIYGASLNDSVCRDAARKSASGSPANAESRARLLIGQMNSRGGGLVSHFSLVPPVVTEITSQPKLRRNPENDELLNPGGLVTGSVTVTTQVEVTPFALPYIIGRRPPLTLQSRQTFPISYVMPPN
jgi:Flp pilus assembly protein TadG